MSILNNSLILLRIAGQTCRLEKKTGMWQNGGSAVARGAGKLDGLQPKCCGDGKTGIGDGESGRTETKLLRQFVHGDV